MIGSGGNVTLSGLTLRNGSNQSGNGGGAIYNFGTLADSCTFTNNSATNGGAISSSRVGTSTAVNLTLRDCTFSGNTGTTQGGAFYNSGGGVATVADSFIVTQVHSSIVAGNTNTDVDFVGGFLHTIQSSGYNLIAMATTALTSTRSSTR